MYLVWTSSALGEGWGRCLKGRDFCTPLRLFITFQTHSCFRSTHMKDYYTAHFQCFAVFLLFDSISSWMGSPTVRATMAEQDSIPELEGLETLPLETGSNNNSKD